MRLLVDTGANLEAHDCHFGTPLHVACAREHLDCVKILLNSGVGPDTLLSSCWVVLKVLVSVTCFKRGLLHTGHLRGGGGRVVHNFVLSMSCAEVTCTRIPSTENAYKFALPLHL